MRKEILIRLIMVVIGLIGISIIYLYSGWETALGWFLATWGNNYGIRKHTEDTIKGLANESTMPPIRT